ncbi:hypothetical protein [Paenibacillus aceti]|uniref:Uncharacterized protein n=1 Tax=Paenibacillus aceti TaxID=1820010 RepID=A0ABQ1VQY4_9BACL|nr:hypothetical protein [Paenibacillus aceti]GGF86859.1 hypothetical protein GCM10010913_05420 [Paenibacillus aceti]
MAKSKFDKLLEAIEAANKIKSESAIGEEIGQFTKESFDEFTSAIGAADTVSKVKDSEPSVYEEALASLVSSVKAFKDSAIQDSKEREQRQNKVVADNQNLELKGVILKGWHEGRKGTHSIHLKNRIVSFVDGRSDVTPELAEDLQKAGYIE